HLFETQAVGVDQKPVVAAGQPDRDVGVDAVVETEPMDQPVGGGEINPGLPGSVLDGRGWYVRCHGRKGSSFELVQASCCEEHASARLNCRQSTINYCTKA